VELKSPKSKNNFFFKKCLSFKKAKLFPPQLDTCSWGDSHFVQLLTVTRKAPCINFGNFNLQGNLQAQTGNEDKRFLKNASSHALGSGSSGRAPASRRP
jgi:hypothetical protein